MTPEELFRDRYQILHRLGAGGGGPVYKAVQLSTGQTVAIKLLSLESLEGQPRARRLERFRREIAFCSRLYHPDIVRLLDSGELADGTPFAVFEYIPGITLAQLLSEQATLKVQRARSLMMQLLPPLGHAHEQGIFHRDLKPSNIMVMVDGARERVKILDLGISIAAGLDQAELGRLTLSHEWVGTPTYAAPEQLRGDSLGAKSDLYAWGLIFVECLTGEVLATGKSLPEIIRQQLLPDPYPLPAALREHRLGALLSRVLEKDPARRLGDAGLLLSLLEGIGTSDLEDGHGYLRALGNEASRSRSSTFSDTLTDGRRAGPAEERRATIVCCKLVLSGDGELSTIGQLDTLLEETNGVVREIMGQFGATPAESFGEYSLGYFGLSRARDADARLALRTAIEIVHRLDKTPEWVAARGFRLRAQLGIHNGTVAVRLHDGSRRQVDGFNGSVAMRLASFDESDPRPSDDAAPILVSDAFRQLVARHAHFETDRATTMRLPWRPDPVPIFRLRAVSPAGSARTLSDSSTFVGRKQELETLLEAWRRARSGVAVIIEGEPGIGKSRLAMELGRRPETAGTEWLDLRCLPEWQSGSLRPLATFFTQKLGIAGLSSREAGARVEREVVDWGLDPSLAVPLLCGWLMLALPDAAAPLPWSPQKQREMLHQVLAEALLTSMERGAALLIEDLHWADPSTLDCLDVLLSRARGRTAFVLMTARPGLRFPWTTPPQKVELKGLDGPSASQLAKILLPNTAPNDLDLDNLATRSDGVPLFLEELATAFRTGIGSEPVFHRVGSREIAATQAVPASLRDLLTSRLDDVGEAKQVGQFAAAVGREFSLKMLADLCERDEVALLGDLEQLVSSDILINRLDMGGTTYAFRHALIRDAAYESMPLSGRQRSHERIAEGLEARFAHLVEAQPDVMAHHWELAGHAERSLRYWQLAARKSGMASAHLEALSQLERGIVLLEQLPVSTTRALLEAELVLARGATQVAKRGYTDPLAAQSFERVASLVPASGQTLELAFAARWGLWSLRNTQANLRSAWELAGELSAIAEQARDSAFTVSALEAQCETTFCLGRLREATSASRRCEAEYDFERHRNLCAVRGDDPHLASLSFEALAELLQGRLDSALIRAQQGLDHATRLSHPNLKSGMMGQAAWLHLIWGTSGARLPVVGEARKLAGTAMQLADEHGFPFWAVYGSMIDGAARIATGDTEALGQLRQGSDIWKGAGAALGRCWQLTFIGEALRRMGDYEGALAVLDEALTFCEEHDSRYFEPEVRRQRAEVWLDPGNPRRNFDAALADCARAMAAAKDQEAHWWALATGMTLVRSGLVASSASVAELRETLGRLPVASREPPLLREARMALT